MNNILMYSNMALWIVVILQTLFIILLTKSIKHFLNNLRLNENNKAKDEKMAPLFREIDIKGNIIKLKDSKFPTNLLFFGSDTCNICKETLVEIKSKVPNYIRTIVIANEQPPNDYLSSLIEESNIVLIRSDALFVNYNINETPTLFLIDSRGVIQSEYDNNELPQLVNDLKYKKYKVS